MRRKGEEGTVRAIQGAGVGCPELFQHEGKVSQEKGVQWFLISVGCSWSQPGVVPAQPVLVPWVPAATPAAVQDLHHNSPVSWTHKKFKVLSE